MATKGFPLELFTEESQQTIVSLGLICYVCKLVLRVAVQVTCGTRFCESCFLELFADTASDVIMCLYCEQDENAENPLHLVRNAYQPDNFCRNQIKRLTARCKCHILGCIWTGKINDIQDHLQDCSFNRPQTCECGEEFSNGLQLRDHLEAGCPKGAVAPISSPCAACGNREVKSFDHIIRICSDAKALQTELVVLFPRVEKTVGLTSNAPVATRSDNASVGPVSTEIVRPDQYEALLNKYKANTSLITVLFNEVKTCSHKLMSMDSEIGNSDIESVKQTVVVLERLARDMQSKVPAIERQLQDAGVHNTSGRLTWRIDNVSQRMEEARTGTIPALYSQPFFTDDAGYKMCARLYLNGDGIGKDSHVSLFFVLMKGRFDPILSWPFTHRVTMLLLDQSGDGNHVQEKFRPDPNSSSFQRPRSEMNIATGCPRFISKNDLERRKTLYTRENTMFIQIIVE